MQEGSCPGRAGVINIISGEVRDWCAGDGSCKLWNVATLACLQTLGAESGGVTSCHIALAGGATSGVGQHAVLVTVLSWTDLAARSVEILNHLTFWVQAS